jgi:mannose-6-phosphate isomerase-like protein (cupin superfamily)
MENYKPYTEKRPWGQFRQFVLNQPCTVKILSVNARQKLSLQSHQLRDELWIALNGGLRARIGEKIIKLKKGDEVFIPRKTKHRLIGGKKKGQVLEISFGVFDENDEERFSDIYRRT